MMLLLRLSDLCRARARRCAMRGVMRFATCLLRLRADISRRASTEDMLLRDIDHIMMTHAFYMLPLAMMPYAATLRDAARCYAAIMIDEI